MVQPLGKTVWWFLKKLNIELLYNPVISTSRYRPKQIENKYMYMHVLSSIIHNSQKVETTQVSTDG